MNQIIRPLNNPLIAVCLFSVICASTTFGQAPADAINVWQPHRSLDQPSSPVELSGDALSEIEQVVFDAPPMAGCETYYLPPSAMPATSVQPVVVPVDDICYLGDPYPNAFVNNEPWQFQLLPDGVIWSSYMAGVRESRTSGVVYGDQGGATLLDVSLGGRMAIFRNGTRGPSAKTGRPEGLEFQIEGAAIPRLNLDENWDLESVDFRFGMPIVLARENWQWKFSYYHLSAHLGDEFAIREAALGQRINYSRDVFVLGLSYFTSPAWRWYGEGGWAFYTDGGSEPWEFQFGVDISEPGPTGPSGTPFVAFNGHLREEVDFGGNFVGQAGWLWRGDTGRTVRAGVHYHNGKSSQFEFFDQFEKQIGGGIWADF